MTLGRWEKSVFDPCGFICPEGAHRAGKCLRCGSYPVGSVNERYFSIECPRCGRSVISDYDMNRQDHGEIAALRKWREE